MVSIRPPIDTSYTGTSFEERLNMLMFEVIQAKHDFRTRVSKGPGVKILNLQMSPDVYDMIYSKVHTYFTVEQLEQVAKSAECQRDMCLAQISMQTKWSLVHIFTILIPVIEHVWDHTTLKRKDNANNLRRGQMCEAIRLVADGAFRASQKVADCIES